MKKFWTKEIIPILIIVSVAFFLRVYQVNKIPPALSWDEVSIGYNAYSILTSGRDEHGRFLPLNSFVAFGDYKPSLPIYLTVPSVALFGLNEFAVRLPSILAGTLTVLLTYFLVKELFRNSLISYHLSLITAFLLAISPWHWQLSRAGFEANIAVMFIVWGAWLVLRARYRPKLLYCCWLPFAAVVYTFNSARYFSPILALGLLLFCGKEFLKHRKETVSGMIIACVVLLPILPHLLSPAARLRFQEVSIFTDDSIVRVANQRITNDSNLWWSRLIHNRRWGYFRSYFTHFLDHLEARFLFIKGDGNPKFSLQDSGELYLVELPFLVLGVYYLALHERKAFWLLIFWLLGAIAPAAVARETPHALRTENTLPVWQIFTAFGLVSSLKHQLSGVRKNILLAVVSLLLTFSFGYFWHNYFNHYATEYSGEWQYGYREAIRYTQPIKDKYQNIILSENIGRPYIYVAFYEKMRPEVFWAEVQGGFDAAGFYNVGGLGKYLFVRSVYDKSNKQNLYIVPPDEIPSNAHVLKTINLLNGKPILVIYDLL